MESSMMNSETEAVLPLLLVAEDNASNYALVETILKRQYRLIHAKTGVEAVELFKLNHPVLILMDIKMPEMDGLTATRLIRQEDENVPIIALTAFAYNEDRENARNAGCTDFITKPLNPKSLKESIAALLQ